MEHFIYSIYIAYTCDMIQYFSGILSYNFTFKTFYSKATILYWQEKKHIKI